MPGASAVTANRWDGDAGKPALETRLLTTPRWRREKKHDESQCAKENAASKCQQCTSWIERFVRHLRAMRHVLYPPSSSRLFNQPMILTPSHYGYTFRRKEMHASPRQGSAAVPETTSRPVLCGIVLRLRTSDEEGLAYVGGDRFLLMLSA